MNRTHIINELEKLINNQYIFLYEQKEKWNDEITFFKKLVNRFRNDSSFFFGIQDLLRTLADPHLYLCHRKLTGFIPNFLPFWVKGKLYLSQGIIKSEEHYGEILKINHEPVDEIVRKYKDKYPGINSTIINNLMIEDIMLGRFTFYADMNIEVEQNDKIIFHRINRDDIKKDCITIKNNNYFDVVSQPTRHNIRYIKIQSFNNTFDWGKVISSIKEDKIIFDIRKNRGGNIRSAIELVSYLISKDLFIDDYYAITNYNEKYIEIIPKGNKSFADKMIVILINENTMGCAEYIFARSLVKYMNAYTVGTPTLGISGDSELYNINKTIPISITTTKYISPQTDELKQGLIPDYIAEQTIDDIINKRDVQLRFAMNMLINSHQTCHYSQYLNVM